MFEITLDRKLYGADLPTADQIFKDVNTPEQAEGELQKALGITPAPPLAVSHKIGAAPGYAVAPGVTFPVPAKAVAQQPIAAEPPAKQGSGVDQTGERLGPRHFGVDPKFDYERVLYGAMEDLRGAQAVAERTGKGMSKEDRLSYEKRIDTAKSLLTSTGTDAIKGAEIEEKRRSNIAGENIKDKEQSRLEEKWGLEKGYFKSFPVPLWDTALKAATKKDADGNAFVDQATLFNFINEVDQWFKGSANKIGQPKEGDTKLDTVAGKPVTTIYQGGKWAIQK
jgi:hypothetical protein